MAYFNFEIKAQTYKTALDNTRQYLLQEDIENGVYYLKIAIQVCNELVANSHIAEIKSKYMSESRKLNEILVDITKNNHNPFTQKKVNKPASNGSGSRSSSSYSEESEGGNQFFKETPPNVTLASVAGLEKVKEQILLDVITPIKYRDLYLEYKDKMGCQILMYGPPGCGKSFVAEAIAGELKCAYAIINASDILDKYVGEAPKKIVQIFEESKKYDRCLIFFDELDALFADRESDDSRHTKDVLTTFLTCLSGFNSGNGDQVRVVIGATNRPWSLDSALLRGKRFDTHIYVGLPDADARKFLINKMYKNRPALLSNTDVSIDLLTRILDSYSCADIESILGKINSLALKRSVLNREKGIDKIEPITLSDVKEVMGSYRNSVTKESLAAFEAFGNGEL